ncbi:MAG: Prenyltransferase [Phycisphaerales bacterium]|nr:Prenyltransferase [Phycisphaerales bacterium]
MGVVISRPFRSAALCRAVCAVLAIATAAAPLQAQGVSSGPLSGKELTPDAQKAIERGLDALSRHQQKDGSFGTNPTRSVAVSALCALAFMQAGNLPGRGRYGELVEKSTTFVLSAAQESGLICADQIHPPMYGHGFSTLFLSEVFGMTGDERVKEKLQKAVRLIERCQNEQGGWRYQPAPTDADISVTIVQLMALRGARDAGIKVEKEVVDHAISYVRRCQNGDGGFSYRLNQGFGGDSGFARTGAGVASLFYAGVSEGKEIDKGLDFLRKYMPGKAARGEVEGNYYYGQYYAVQAMYQAGGKDWVAWYPAIRDQLLQRQNKATGLWSGDVNDEYATAMSLLILQMPNRYLPVYAGKGPGS